MANYIQCLTNSITDSIRIAVDISDLKKNEIVKKHPFASIPHSVCYMQMQAVLYIVYLYTNVEQESNKNE